MIKLFIVFALLVFGVAKGDAVQYVEKVSHNDAQVPQPNAKVQELDRLTEIEKQNLLQNAYVDEQE
jgi:mannitol-1-phosphate/altronate dehydrogenase